MGCVVFDVVIIIVGIVFGCVLEYGMICGWVIVVVDVVGKLWKFVVEIDDEVYVCWRVCVYKKGSVVLGFLIVFDNGKDIGSIGDVKEGEEEEEESKRKRWCWGYFESLWIERFDGIDMCLYISR